jgi:hypothetical protein
MKGISMVRKPRSGITRPGSERMVLMKENM